MGVVSVTVWKVRFGVWLSETSLLLQVGTLSSNPYQKKEEREEGGDEQPIQAGTERQKPIIHADSEKS